MTWVSQRDVAEHLDLSTRWVRRLTAEGVLVKGEQGLYDLDASRVAYVRHLRELAAGRASARGDALDLAAERARLARAQSERVEMENAVTRSELVPVAIVEAWMVQLFSNVVQRIRALPAKLAPMVFGTKSIAECEGILRLHIDECSEEIAAAKWIAPGRRGSTARGGVDA